MHPLFSLVKNTGRAIALLSVLALAATAQVTPSFHIAYAVDTQALLGGSPNANYNKLLVRDLHEDHYHTFTANNGTNPEGHVPMPIAVNVSGGYGAVSFASWNDSEYATSSRYAFPSEPLNLHLELVSVSSSNLIVELQHDDHYHQLFAGEEGEHLHFGDFQNLRFSFADGAAPGDYSAVFRIVDESAEGAYVTSNNFTINVAAIPEPSSATALAGALALGLVATRRRRVRA